MFKKLLYSFMIILALSSIALGSYRFFESQADVKVSTSNEFVIEYEGAKQYVLSKGNSSTTYLFFCSFNNDNCNYIENTLYSDVNKELVDRKIEDIVEYVDIDNIDESRQLETLLNDWQINNFPAFVSVSTNDEALTINNSLVWNNEVPMTANDILSWLSINNLYEGEISQQVLMP